MRLMREIRFSLGPESPSERASINGWAGMPGSDAICPHLILQAVVSGPVEKRTGYLCNIKLIDKLLRENAVEHLRIVFLNARRRCRVAEETVNLWKTLANQSPPTTVLEQVTLQLSPHASVSVSREEPTMARSTYAFEFSAAHRLWCPDMTDLENFATFGRCTNPNGHGHNYVLRVTLKGQPDPRFGTLISLAECERIVTERVIDRFDHKHLNLDCSDFAERNPSVENIAMVIFDLLTDKFPPPATLDRVRVYETPKTWAEYDGKP